MPKLVLGPLLRYVGEMQATIWVETDTAAEVEVLVAPAGPDDGTAGRARGRAPTFPVAGHHYALVLVEGLAPDRTCGYRVELDGRPAMLREPGGDSLPQLEFLYARQLTDGVGRDGSSLALW
jgi:hypothetical protein